MRERRIALTRLTSAPRGEVWVGSLPRPPHLRDRVDGPPRPTPKAVYIARFLDKYGDEELTRRFRERFGPPGMTNPDWNEDKLFDLIRGEVERAELSM